VTTIFVGDAVSKVKQCLTVTMLLHQYSVVTEAYVIQVVI